MAGFSGSVLRVSLPFSIATSLLVFLLVQMDSGVHSGVSKASTVANTVHSEAENLDHSCGLRKHEDNSSSKMLFPFLSCNMQVRKMRDYEFRFMSSWTHVTATLERSTGNILMHKYLAEVSEQPLWSLDMRDAVRHHRTTHALFIDAAPVQVVDIVNGDEFPKKDAFPSDFCLVIQMPNNKAFCCEMEDGIQL